MAEEPDGPYTLRNQLPLHLLFLDQTPRTAHLLQPRKTRLAVYVTYESTHAATDSLISLFRADDFATFDGLVTQPLLEAVAASTPGGTAYFLDGETMRTVLDASLGVGSRFEIGLEVPFLLHTGGFLDSIIDNYHDRFDLPDGGRTSFQRDRYVSGYVGDGASVFIEDRGGVGLGDIVLTGRAALLRASSRRPAITLSASAKLPTGDPDRLDGSGSADYSAALQVSARLGRSSLHGGYAYTIVGDWDLAPSLPLSNSESLFATYSFAATPHTSLIVQFLRTRGPFEFRAGSDIGRVSNEIALGLRHRMAGGVLFDWALIENLNTDLNTPDVGAFLGVTYYPGETRTPGMESRGAGEAN
jgi:hypothetical protein